jgi:hypothetical protein
MTIAKRDLKKWQESTFTPMTEEQRQAILDRFGTEPWPYEWTEQDIIVQIQNFLGCGEFVKEGLDTDYRWELPDGEDF